MQLIIKEKNKVRINKLLDWTLYMAGYTLVFILVTSLFSSIYIDSNHLIFWSFLVVGIVYVLNKTVKPILFKLTLPITGITFGLFYLVINLFILKISDWILGPHFELRNIWIALLVSILLSMMNIIIEEIIKSIIKKVKKHG